MTLNRRVATTSRSSETRSAFRHEDDTALLPAISHSRTFVPAMPPAQPLAARQARTAAETGSVVTRLRYLTAGGAILAALPGATVLEPDEATDGGRSTKGFLGGAIASALKESGDETLAHDNCSPAPPVDPRPSAFAGPGPSFPRVIQVACSAAICVAVSSKSDGFHTFSAGAHSRRRSLLIRSEGVLLDPAAPLLLVPGGLRAHAGPR